MIMTGSLMLFFEHVLCDRLNLSLPPLHRYPPPPRDSVRPERSKIYVPGCGIEPQTNALSRAAALPTELSRHSASPSNTSVSPHVIVPITEGTAELGHARDRLGGAGSRHHCDRLNLSLPLSTDILRLPVTQSGLNEAKYMCRDVESNHRPTRYPGGCSTNWAIQALCIAL